MEANKSFIFGPFRLDLANERLSRENDDIRLTPKAFAVLKYLVERSDRLVTKDDLLENVWADAYVTEAALTVCITEIRKALGDDAKEPKFIETVHRRGYRFIEPLKIDDQLTSQNDSHVSSGVSPSGEADAAIRTPERDTAIDSKPPLEREKELTHSDNVVRRAFPVKAAVASIWAKAAMAIAAVLLVGVGALFGWNVYRQAAFAPETVSSKERSRWSDNHLAGSFERP